MRTRTIRRTGAAPFFIVGLAIAVATATPRVFAADEAATTKGGRAMSDATAAGNKDLRTDADWKKVLTAEQFDVLRKKGTERAFTGAYWDCHDKGLYRCAACGAPLFSSDTKFDSGTGWPSFWQPVAKDAVEDRVDKGFFMTRTEVVCSRCGGHLGHVFDDGPPPTHLRYCINSVCLKLDKGGLGQDAPATNQAVQPTHAAHSPDTKAK